MSPNTSIIFGPPGTGKTTKLLSIVDEKLQSGMLPSQICYVGFTRRAANEAKERAIEKFKLPHDQFPWFRTLHSLAFQMLCLNKANIMGIGDYLALCKQLGLSITVGGFNNEEGSFGGQSKGDRLFFAEAMARSRMQSLKTYWESIPDEDLYFYELQQLRDALESYKKQHNKSDFTDIIYQYADDPSLPAPPAQVLIVDEAQDLSPLQWEFVAKLSEGIGETYVAGDDDQAIFRWAGANVDKLIDLPGARTVLTQSYRVPEEVQKIAGTISERISKRVEKHWKAREAKGEVIYTNAVQEIDMAVGKWLLLARNTVFLEQFAYLCLQSGYLYESKSSIVDVAAIAGIKVWNELRQGRKITGKQVKTLYEYLASGSGVSRGFKGKADNLKDTDLFDHSALRQSHGLMRRIGDTWDQALERISDRDREYFLSAGRNGEDLNSPPRIRISTIHGAKGAEADNVAIITDMAYRTHIEMEKCEDDEHRVWYVAVTRARERLFIVMPQTDRYYQI